MAKEPNRQTTVLPLAREDRSRLERAVKAAEDKKRPLGLPPVTVARALAGYPIRAGTAALIRERLAAAEEAA